MENQMKGKVVLITGANRGIGFASAKALAKLGATLILVCRDEERGRSARDEIAKSSTGPEPILLLADLSSQSEIRRLATKVHQRVTKIDVLINNVGSIFGKRALGPDGIERTFALNHLSVFLLTLLLLDLLQAAPEGRIINLTSDSHLGKLDFGNLQAEKHYNFFSAYNLSKLGNILFTYELARRLKNSRVTVNCYSPGPTHTDFGSQVGGFPRLLFRTIKKIPGVAKSADFAAQMIVHLASSQETAGVSGKFFSRQREATSKPITYNAEVARKFWDVSERMTSENKISASG